MKSSRAVLLLAGVVVAAGLLSALLLPRLIDSQIIKDRIRAELFNQFAGSVTFDKITLSWFPRPEILIENAKIAFDDGVQASIQATKVYPSLLYLFIGRFVVRRALLQQPNILIHLPAFSEEPFDPGEVEKQIHSALVSLTQAVPAARIAVSNGTAEIRIGVKPPVILENIGFLASPSSKALDVDFSARSNLWERVKINAIISPENLATRVEIGVQRLKIRESLLFLLLPFLEVTRQGEANLDVKIASVGLRKVKASFSGSSERIVLAGRGRSTALEVKRLKGGINYEAGDLRVDVEQLELGEPRFEGSGRIEMRSGSISATIKARDVDIAKLGDLALRMGDDPESVKKILRYAPSGTIREINIQTAGRSLGDLALSQNLVLAGLLRNLRIFIPAVGLELMNVDASIQLSGGVLEAKNITASLGAAKGWNGTLRLGLEGASAPFHLDMSVQTGAAELQSVLLKLIRDEAARDQLLKWTGVHGELSGRLSLGETVDAISPVITISKADISAHYAPVPFPITIRQGRLSYDSKVIRLENARGSVGHSSFVGLGVTLYHDGTREIKVECKRMLSDLQQTSTLLRRFEASRSYFEKLQSVRGQIHFQDLTLTGAYDDPSHWLFSTKGAVDQVEIKHADFPDGITVSRGTFVANEHQIVFSDAVTAMSDASWTAGGTFEYNKAGAMRFMTSGKGTLGARMTQWFGRYAGLPDEVKLRSPLKIVSGHFGWGANGDISFRGQVVAAAGAALSLDAVIQRQSLALRNLAIDDGGRIARTAFRVTKNDLDFSLNGELMQQTIDKLFSSFPIKIGSLRGDIQASTTVRDPVHISARGQVSGTDLLIPLAKENALIEKFDIEADGENVLVKSADVRWGKGQLAVFGKLSGAKNKLRVEADVTGDRVDWKKLQDFLGVDSEQPRQKKSVGALFPVVEGTIRLKTERFVFERFNFNPLEATASFSPSGVGIDIDRAVACGITANGRVDIHDTDIGVALRFSAADEELEPTSVCLTNQQNDVKGSYSLTASLAGRGSRGQLLQSLNGDFEFSARDGEFIRSPGIDAAFDYLNTTGDFKIAFPDLDKETFPYRSIDVKGKIEGQMLIGDEVNVTSSLLNLSGQGKVDLELNRIEGKGLITVFRRVDDVIKRLPLISQVLGEPWVGIPVRVTGTLARPDVTYLSPADVGRELLNIPLKILGMPFGAIRLFTPEAPAP